MNKTTPMSFLAACREYFGMKPQQAPVDFLKELKALSEADRAEIKKDLEANGYVIQDAAK